MTHKLSPTTAETLAGRDGIIVVAHVVWLGGMHSLSSTWDDCGMAFDVWRRQVLAAADMARLTDAARLFVKINDDAQTIRVLVDGDDALVVVHQHDCKYHRSLARAMRVALKGLKVERKQKEFRDNFVKQLNSDPEFAAKACAS